jgi:hypothetical protein
MNRIASIGLAMAATLAMAGCSAENSGGREDPQEGGAGRGGGGGVDGSGGVGAGGDAATGGTGGGADTLEELCAVECEKKAALVQQFGCLSDTTCTPDCIDYGLSVGECQDEYVSLLQCVAETMDNQVCYCAVGDDLQCDLCWPERSTFLGCLDASGF